MTPADADAVNISEGANLPTEPAKADSTITNWSPYDDHQPARPHDSAFLCAVGLVRFYWHLAHLVLLRQVEHSEKFESEPSGGACPTVDSYPFLSEGQRDHVAQSIQRSKQLLEASRATILHHVSNFIQMDRRTAVNEVTKQLSDSVPDTDDLMFTAKYRSELRALRCLVNEPGIEAEIAAVRDGYLKEIDRAVFVDVPKTISPFLDEIGKRYFAAGLEVEFMACPRDRVGVADPWWSHNEFFGTQNDPRPLILPRLHHHDDDSVDCVRLLSFVPEPGHHRLDKASWYRALPALQKIVAPSNIEQLQIDANLLFTTHSVGQLMGFVDRCRMTVRATNVRTESQSNAAQITPIRRATWGKLVFVEDTGDVFFDNEKVGKIKKPQLRRVLFALISGDPLHLLPNYPQYLQ